MVVAVMEVGRVLVIVLDPVVHMHVGVRADQRRIVAVRVVTVVVEMRVLVLDRLVHVAVAVALGDVQVDTETEQAGRGDGQGSGVAISECPAERCTDERSQREHRAGTSGADPPLREQVEVQARSISGRSTGEQDGCRR